MTKLLSAASAVEFKAALSAIDIHVPPRSKGRKKEQGERYSIAHLLASLPSEDILYPVNLTQQERPDFFLQMANLDVGIEHVEAVPESHVRASIYRQKGDGPQVHLLKKHQPGEFRRSKKAILNDIIRDKASPPWVGNEVEVDWARVMLHFIDSKVKIINKSGFAKFEENWLLIYNNWPLPGVHHEEVCSLLTDSFPNKILPSEFNRVFILDSKVLCEFGKRTRLHPVKPPSAGA